MKKYTFKDFISHNSPCFSCGELAIFQIGIYEKPSESEIYLKPIVQQGFTGIDLHIGWSSTLKLNVDHKTNQFATNNMAALKNYLNDRTLFLKANCSCSSSVESSYLEFNLEKHFIKSVSLKQETTIIYDSVNMYQVYSNYYQSHTVSFIDRINPTTPTSPIRLDTPLLPRSKFKNKEALIKKLKVYATFS